jgi:hypothetical protein
MLFFLGGGLLFLASTLRLGRVSNLHVTLLLSHCAMRIVQAKRDLLGFRPDITQAKVAHPLKY